MSDDFARVDMHALALEVMPAVLGQPNKLLSNSTELIWGKKGSFKVHLADKTWYDHSEQDGGGALKMVQKYQDGCSDKGAAVAWMVDHGYLPKREQQQQHTNGHDHEYDHGRDAGADQQRASKFGGFMDAWPIATYDYHDAKGNLAYQVHKFAKTEPRRFIQTRPHPKGGTIWGLQAGKYGKTRSGDWFKAKDGKKYEAVEEIGETPWFLYHRAEVRKAIKEGRPVFLCEGEKDVETLRAWNLCATTNQGGARNWKPELDADLKGADLIIMPDNDTDGRMRVTLRGDGLKGICKRIRVLDLAQHWKDAPEKADVTDWKEKAGGTVDQLVALAAAAPDWHAERPREFGAYYHDEVYTEGGFLDFIIDDWMTVRGRSVIAGASGSGKSFLALHMAYCLARGVPFFEYAVQRRGVIYQAGEGGLGMKKRQRAYVEHFGVPREEDVPLVMLPGKVDLFTSGGDTERLIATIKAVQATMSIPLGAVFIDTLATATTGADENSTKDMGMALANIARIEEECQVHVCLVHHMDALGKKIRGSTSIHANVDAVITVTVDEEAGRLRTAKLLKQKDGEDGLKLPFTLAGVKVGVNERTGRDITSCVVLTVSEKEAMKKEGESYGHSVRPREVALLGPFFAARKRYGRFVATEADGPAAAVGQHVVEFNDFLDVCVEQDATGKDRETIRHLIRTNWKRYMDFLQRAKVIGFERTGEKSAVVWWYKDKPIRGFPETFPEGSRNRTNPAQSPRTARAEPAQEISEGLAEVLDEEQGKLDW